MNSIENGQAGAASPSSAVVRRASFNFTAGILLCGKIRDYLEARRFEGMDIEWREGLGWIEREWIVRGETSDIVRVHREIMAWINANGLHA